jgi:hypothetical protein
MTFLGDPKIDIEPIIEGIRDRRNIGRWRRDKAAKVVDLSLAAQADLERFGYDVELTQMHGSAPPAVCKNFASAIT